MFGATIESMRPELRDAYYEIVERYRKEYWGIYDDTIEMERAVILSDGYYGDGSSVLQLYQKTDKPIMLQTIHSMQNKNNQIAFADIVKYKGEWWFFSAKSNLICRMDKKTLKVVPVVAVPTEWKRVEYRDMYIYRDKIFLIPFSTPQIIIYDILEDAIRKINVPIEKSWRGNPFSEGILIENRLYLLPQALNKLIYVDVVNESVKEAIEKIEDKNNPSDVYFSDGYINYNTCELLMGKTLKNEFVCTNLTGSKKKTYAINDIVSDGWGHIIESKNGTWYVPYTADRIFFVEREGQVMHEFTNFPQGYIVEKCSFIKSFVHKDKLYLIPKSSNLMIVIDEKGNMYAPIKSEEKWDKNSYYEDSMRYSNIWEDEGRLYIFSSIRGQIIELTDIEKPIYRNVDFSVCDNWCIGKSMSFTYGEERESNFENVFFLIRYILQRNISVTPYNNIPQKAGKKIFDKCKLNGEG